MATMAEPRLYTYTVYHGMAWYGMATLGVVLLTLCSLLAGLTLALGGLDMTWLQLRSVTGTPKQRQQALVVARIKRHSTWMLCSFILCSVACGESLPFIIQSLWHGNQKWAPILFSTFSIAFFAEILPQYLIPRHTIAWGYYCWPLIWASMWLTSILSYPLARFLDTVSRRKDEHSLFTNDEMAAIIKYHEQSERHGGMIGPDATRIMLGALSLDSRKIGGDITLIPEKHVKDEKDVEKADLVILQGMIVHWSAVKTISIDDPVDKAFISRIKRWSYSRIPVIGSTQSPEVQDGKSTTDSSWKGKQVFGFLHVKNLLGLDISKNKVFVRDLPLYPLPIVHEDMPVYDLLNIFQLGMSRMAIVVPKPFNSLQANIQTSPKGSFNEFQAPRWTATEKMNAHILSRLKGLGLDGSTDWPTDFMGAAKSNIENPVCPKKDVVGIRCPKPVGIVTFEDVIDAILQKTSRDERDFFDRENIPPPTKSKKTGDYINPQHDIGQKDDGVPVYARKAQVSFQRSLPRTLRRRNVSTKVLPATGAMDGADELSIDSAGALAIILRRSRSSYEDSSYTENSQGGFRCSDESRSTVISLPKAEELVSSSPCIVLDSPVRTSVKTPIRTPLKTPIKTPIKASARTVSLPSKRAVAIALPERLTPGLRQVSSGVRLPRIRRVTPFSRQHYSSYERMEQTEKQESISSVAPMSPAAVPARQSDPSTDINHPKVDTDSSVEPSRSLDNAGKSSGESSGVALSLVSWCPNGLVDVDKWNEGIYDSSAVDSSATLMVENHAPTPECEVQQDTDNIAPEPYGGFPPELLDVSNTGKENRTSKAVASTLPRMIGLRADVDSLVDRHDCVGPVREESFHDDRAMLPSQRRVINTSASMNMSGPRSSSLWF